MRPVLVAALLCGVAAAQISTPTVDLNAPSRTPAQQGQNANPLATPTINLNQQPPAPAAAGATDATPPNVAGASDATLYNVPAQDAGTTATGGTARREPAMDTGVGSIGGPGGLSPLPDGRSLGEIAAEYRKRREERRAARARRMAQEQAMQMAANGGAAAGNPVTQANAAAQPEGASTQTNQGEAERQEMAQRPAPVEQAPQVQVMEEQPVQMAQNRELPRTASWLPLLVALGAAVAGVGAVRARRRIG